MCLKILTDASVEFSTSENLFNTKLFNWESSIVKRRIFSKTDEVLTGLLFNRAEYHFESAYLNFKPSSRGLREHFHEPSNGLFQLLMPLHSVSGLVPRFYFFYLFFLLNSLSVVFSSRLRFFARLSRECKLLKTFSSGGFRGAVPVHLNLCSIDWKDLLVVVVVGGALRSREPKNFFYGSTIRHAFA